MSLRFNSSLPWAQGRAQKKIWKSSSAPSLEQRRRRFSREVGRLPQEYKAIRPPRRYRVDHSDDLTKLAISLAERATGSRWSPGA